MREIVAGAYLTGVGVCYWLRRTFPPFFYTFCFILGLFALIVCVVFLVMAWVWG